MFSSFQSVLDKAVTISFNADELELITKHAQLCREVDSAQQRNSLKRTHDYDKPSPEELFVRFLDITGDKKQCVSSDDLYQKFELDYPVSKKKFKGWMKEWGRDNMSRGVRCSNTHNRPFLRGVKLKDADTM